MFRLLLPHVFIALGLCGSLWLFLTLKTELQNSLRKQRRRTEEIAARLNEAWQLPAPQVINTPAVPRSGLNINRRVQAIRMMRRGDDVSHVAAVLGVTRQEVELLVRVQAAVKAASKAAGSSG
jgi:hypothetical protein